MSNVLNTILARASRTWRYAIASALGVAIAWFLAK